MDIKDGGYKSRKMVMAYIAMALGFVAFLLTGVWPSLVVVFPELCAFLLGATTIYTGGNAAVKAIVKRATQNTTQP